MDSSSDIDTLRLLEGKVGRAFPYQIEDSRCVELDLTSDHDLYHGLIRHHSDTEKQEILLLICRLKHLRKLNLRRNRLRALPKAFCELDQLEHLTLGSNYLGGIPESISAFRNLRYLHLGNNDIVEIPPFLSGLASLEYLALHKNIRIKSVDNLAGLTKLKSLNLYFLNLHRLPSFICDFRDLVTLTLWNVREFPANLANLTKLEYFTDCGGLSWQSLPEEFVQLKKLRMIRLFQNSLERLPADFGDLENLEQVSLYQNELSDLPESFAKLKKLKKLNLGWNRFTRVPACLRELQSLEWLGLFENPLAQIAADSFPAKAKVLTTWPYSTR